MAKLRFTGEADGLSFRQHRVAVARMHPNLAAAARDEDKAGVGRHLAADVGTRHAVVAKKSAASQSRRDSLRSPPTDSDRIQPPGAPRRGGHVPDRRRPDTAIAQG